MSAEPSRSQRTDEELPRLRGEGGPDHHRVQEVGGQLRDAGAPVSGMQGLPAVGADAGQPVPTAGSGDLALDWFKADAEAQGYTCRKRGCRCGRSWEGYCRRYGIVSPKRQKIIEEHEVCSYEERSTWSSE